MGKPDPKAKSSVFALAIRDTNVHAVVTVEDVLERRPDLARSVAERWLQERGASIGNAMIQAGLRKLHEELGGLLHD